MEIAEIERVKGQFAHELARFRKKEHPSDFPPLPDLPAGRYTDPDFFAAEQKHIWPKSWLFAGHTDEIPEPGSYKLWRDSGVPVVIIRGKGGEIRGFYNTCRHRGGPLVRDESGKAGSLRCPYHSWNYDLDGTLLFVPDEHEFPGLCKEDRGLIPVRVECMGNWIFANLDEDAVPLSEFFGPVAPEMADLRPEELRLVEKHSIPIRCNWKVFMDAFQEVYHIKHIHPETVDAALDYRGATMTLYPTGHSRMCVPQKPNPDSPPAVDANNEPRPSLPEHEITDNSSRSYNLFPNIVTPVATWEFPFLVFWPTSINESRMDVWWFGQEDNCDASTQQWQMRIAMFDQILNEDVENLGFIQESLETPGFTGVPLSYQERRIYNHHEQVDRTIGEENIPNGLAIPQLLEPFVENDPAHAKRTGNPAAES